jgi:SulP family sulfate permease
MNAAMLHRLLPFLRWWPMVTRQTVKADLLAGFSGALIVLPQGVAFATIAGLPPQYGLYAAMVPAVIGALFGSSWHLVSGPTTAISIAVFASLSHHAEPGTERFIELALTMTVMVGVFQVALGAARMGALVNFISHTVVIGFTAGAALLIAGSQVRNFFGIQIPRGTPFFEIIHQLFLQLGDANPYVTAVGAITLAAGILTRRYFRQFPYMISAMIVGSLASTLLNGTLGVAVTGIKTVGALPSGLPPLSLPDFSPQTLHEMLAPSLVITMLALTEAVSISRAIAVRSEQRIDGNQEFIGQGLSNMVGAFFSCYASSGSFNRSGVNYEAGARTPLASIFASLFLVLVLLLVAPLAAYLPTAAMAGILFLVAWGLIDFHHIESIWHTSKAESAILATTLVGTLVNLEEGIFVGVFLSLVMYLYRSSRPDITPMVPAPEEGAYHFVEAKGAQECPQLRIVRINGSIYFGAASHVQQALQQIDEDNPLQKSVLITGTGINFIDVAGAEMLAQEARRRRRMGGGLYFYRMRDRVYKFLRQGDYVKDFGEGAFFPVMKDVTGALYWTLDPSYCRRCKVRVFKQCRGNLLPDGFRRQRLLFATDGTEFSRAPAEVAIALAKNFGVTLDLMTLVGNAAEADTARQRLAEPGRAALAAGVDTEEHVRYGNDPVQAVVAAAAEADANILIIGRKPPTKDLKQRLLGDIAARILADSHTHVLLAGWQSHMWQRRILVAIDDSAISDSATEIAGQLAKATHTPVTLLRAVESEAERVRAEADLAHKAGLLKLEEVACDTMIVTGTPGPAIVKAAEELQADLVVVGSHGRGLNRRLIGSVTDHVVGRLACAVLVIKPPAADVPAVLH